MTLVVLVTVLVTVTTKAVLNRDLGFKSSVNKWLFQNEVMNFMANAKGCSGAFSWYHGGS